MVVTSCTAAQLCGDSLNKNTYNRTTYRVSDEDFDSLFTDAVVTRSSIHCVTLCTTNSTNTFYESNTRICSCQDWWTSYSPVSTGTNHLEKHRAQGRLLFRCWSFMISFNLTVGCSSLCNVLKLTELKRPYLD